MFIDKIFAETKSVVQAAEKAMNSLGPSLCGDYNMADFVRNIKLYKKGNSSGTAFFQDLDRKLNRESRKVRKRQLLAFQPRQMVEKAIESLEETLNKWFREAQESPFHKFCWGDKAVETAAKRKVYLNLLNMMKYVEERQGLSSEVWAEIVAEIRREALNRASSPQASTSAMSNLTETYYTAAMAAIGGDRDYTISQVGHWFQKWERLQEEEKRMTAVGL